MNKLKKMFAVLLAVSAIGGGVSVTANAEDFDAVDENMSADEMVAEYLAGLDYLSASSGDTYKPFEYFAATVSGAPYYIGAFADSFTSSTINFYFHVGAFSTDFDDEDRFSLGENFSTFGLEVQDTETKNGELKYVPVKVSGILNSTTYQEIVRYKVSYDTTAVASVNDLDSYTRYTVNIGNLLETTNTSNQLYKCIYSLGDVDRNGIINDSDVMSILKYVAGLFSADSNRTSDQKKLDKLAFERAADVNRDGVVTNADAQLLSGILLGLASFPS